MSAQPTGYDESVDSASSLPAITDEVRGRRVQRYQHYSDTLSQLDGTISRLAHKLRLSGSDIHWHPQDPVTILREMTREQLWRSRLSVFPLLASPNSTLNDRNAWETGEFTFDTPAVRHVLQLDAEIGLRRAPRELQAFSEELRQSLDQCADESQRKTVFLLEVCRAATIVPPVTGMYRRAGKWPNCPEGEQETLLGAVPLVFRPFIQGLVFGDDELRNTATAILQTLDPENITAGSFFDAQQAILNGDEDSDWYVRATKLGVALFGRSDVVDDVCARRYGEYFKVSETPASQAHQDPTTEAS